MSTTAGIVSADYVAISNLAIFSALLGVATALAIVWQELVYIAAAGLLLGFLALRSIHRSNGTLTGRWIAFTGIGLSLGLAVVAEVAAYYRDLAMQPEKTAINARIVDFAAAVAKANASAAKEADKYWDTAYLCFDPEWRKRVPFGGFKTTMQSWQSGRRILRMEPNNRFEFSSVGGAPICTTRAWVRTADSSAEIQCPVKLRLQPNGQWLIVYIGFFMTDALETPAQQPPPAD
jgi:hypothetical protein